MYILLKPSEEKYSAKGVTITPTRNYTIEVAVENMIAKRNEMINVLQE
ncbi:MAG: hypothetical protein PHD79_09250 [Aliarcobacter sp.]|nr:hypothetical protein [Aliarcobacter sp.]